MNPAISDINNYSFAVQEDQSEDTRYWVSDFLWGKAPGVSPTPDPVPITVKHLFSNIIITLQSDRGYSEDDLYGAEVTICNVKNNANIDLTTGIATATGDISTIKPRREDRSYRALVVPQSIVNQAVVKVKIGDNEYTLEQTIEFVANKQHKCSITVNRTSEGIDIGIGGWETDDMDYGGTVQ